MKKQIILIGGVPTAGKSTIAKVLSKRLDLPWISTDQIRDVMRAVVNREEHPDLFVPEGYDATRYLTEFSAEEIAEDEHAENVATWKGVKAFIREEYTWQSGFIVEGVAILPKQVSEELGDMDNVKAIFVIDEDADRIRDVVFNRGLWNDARTYPDDVKENEVAWVLEYTKRLKADAKAYGFPCVSLTKTDDDVQNVLSALDLS